MRVYFLLNLLIAMVLLSACAMKAPVQEMAEARSAIKIAQQMQGDSVKAEVYLKSAEEALEDASLAIEQERFEKALRNARMAKKKAQQAAKMKQKSKIY